MNTPHGKSCQDVLASQVTANPPAAGEGNVKGIVLAPVSSAVIVEDHRAPVVVTGMGRSGTSLTTELLGRLGLDLGPADRMLPPVANDNPRGYWEQASVVDLNDEVLALFGGNWERPPRLSPGWEDEPAIAPLRRRAAGLLLELFGPTPRRWALKDPRMALTVPFWRPLVGDIDHVICFRHPSDVAASLGRRGLHDLDDAGAVDLWVRYLWASIRNSDPNCRLFLHYEEYFANTDAQLARLTEFVLGPGGADNDERMAALRDCIQPDLWHNRGGAERNGDTVAISEEAAQLYAWLLREAGIDADRDAEISGARAER